jgi:membrane protein DedA with SNARE-associated domain
MSFASLISTYGYAAVAIGTFFEGETVLGLAGLASHRGYLDLPWVIICGFLGTLFGDQLYFHIGRIRGIRALEKRPYWKARARRVFDILHRHQLPLVLGFRFLYGVRTVTPFLLGASGISPVRFLLLNVFGASVWAVLVGLAGYLFGHVLELVIGKIERYELLLFIALALVGAAVWGIQWIVRRKALREPMEPKQ